MIAHSTLLYIDHEIATAIAEPRLIPVDAVVLFGDHTPFHLIETLLPDVLVKGGDYNPDETNPEAKGFIVGSDLVKAAGGEVCVIPFVPGHSTTSLEEKIIRLNA